VRNLAEDYRKWPSLRTTPLTTRATRRTRTASSAPCVRSTSPAEAWTRSSSATRGLHRHTRRRAPLPQRCVAVTSLACCVVCSVMRSHIWGFCPNARVLLPFVACPALHNNSLALKFAVAFDHTHIMLCACLVSRLMLLFSELFSIQGCQGWQQGRQGHQDQERSHCARGVSSTRLPISPSNMSRLQRCC
jgi:hypothetical protein